MFIGRNHESQTLGKVLAESDPHLVALYGRRGVGKTFLIRHFFSAKNVPILEIAGTRKGNKEIQIDKFVSKIEQFFKVEHRLERPTTWHGVFKILTLKIKKPKKPIVVFIDEISWLAGEDDELVNEIDYFWNSEWSKIENLKLILCGSATSWILDKIVNDTGGLHNRLTARIHLSPFSLKEAQQYLNSRKITLERRQILDLYMILGGVPYYLNFIARGDAPYEAVSKICFGPSGDLLEEPTFVLEELYKNYQMHQNILDILSARRYGLNRTELSELTKIPAAGTLPVYLRELLECDFISEYTLFSRKKRDSYYRLTDEFLLFAYKFMTPDGRRAVENNFLKKINTAAFHAWCGYSFENLCHKHSNQILSALGISGMEVSASAWDFRAGKVKEAKNFQIDLVFDRADKVITLCEIKYSKNPYILTKAEASNVKRRQAFFQQRTKKSVNSILISASEVVMTPLVKDTFARVVLGDSLFE